MKTRFTKSLRIETINEFKTCGWPDENRQPEEWPCQQLHGGKDAGVMDLEDSGGMCHHPECNPINKPLT